MEIWFKSESVPRNLSFFHHLQRLSLSRLPRPILWHLTIRIKIENVFKFEFVRWNLIFCNCSGGRIFQIQQHGKLSWCFAAAHFNTLQHTAAHCSNGIGCRGEIEGIQRTALQSTAAHFNTLQHTAAHFNTLQHTAAHLNTLQHTAATA